MALTVAFTWGYGVLNYLTLVLLPTFAGHFCTIAPGQALSLSTLLQLGALALLPLGG